MEKYIILTNNEEFSTETDTPGIESVETYQYYFFNEPKSKFTVAKVKDGSIKIVITDGEDPSKINRIPVRIFPSFDEIEGAQKELNVLTERKRDYAKLEKL